MLKIDSSKQKGGTTSARLALVSSNDSHPPGQAVVDTRRVHAKLTLDMNVALTARHKHLVAEKVKSGAYGSATEVVREGLRLLEAQDEQQRRIGWLQREVEKGFEGPATAWTSHDAHQVRKMIARRARRRG